MSRDLELEVPFLEEYTELYERWPTPDDLRQAVLTGQEHEFATIEHVHMIWDAVRTEQEEVVLNARAWPTYGLADLFVTAWWNTTGRDLPKPPDDPAKAMGASMAELLALAGADPRVRPSVDPSAEDGIDIRFELDCPLRPGLTWDEVDELLRPLTELTLVARSWRFPEDEAAAVLQRHGFLLFRCPGCGHVVTDRMPGWPSGLWLSTSEDAAAVCGRRSSSNALVDSTPVPHTGAPWLLASGG